MASESRTTVAAHRNYYQGEIETMIRLMKEWGRRQDAARHLIVLGGSDARIMENSRLERKSGRVERS